MTFNLRRHYPALLVACVLLSLLWLAWPGNSAAQDAPADGVPGEAVPDAAPQPERMTSTLNPRPGVYYIDYGSNRFSAATYPVDGAIRFYSWSLLNPGDGVYDWQNLDTWIADRKALGLGTGIMVTTYDGSTAGDIRSTPNFVIKTPDAVIPATAKTCATCAEYDHYVNYWKRTTYNATFDSTPHNTLWTLAGNTEIVSSAPADADGIAKSYAAKLGGVNSATGSLYHYKERIPAMPASLNGTKRAYIEARVYVDTADTAANDHLYMEIWDTNHQRIGSAVDITNLSQTNKTWKTYTFDVSSIAPEREIEVAFRVTTNGSNSTTYYVDTIKLYVRHLIPKYWSSAHFDAYKRFIDALGARYRDNPDFQFVAMGTGVYGESQPTQSDSYPDNHFDHVVENAGLTWQGWVEYINRVSAAYAAAFTTAPGQAPNRNILLQYAPTYKSVNEREQTTDYAASLGVGGCANFLALDWTQAYKNDGTGMYDPMQKYWQQFPFAFESYDSDLCSPVLAFWAVAHAVDKHVDYLRAEPALFRNADGSLTAEAPFFDWAGNYLGQTAQTTPKAWVMMREHHNPTLSTCRSGGNYYLTDNGTTVWPQLGNFDFYLTQVDSIAGGRTVPETNHKGADSRYARDPSTGTAWPQAGLGNCPSQSYREDLFGANYPCNKTPYNPDLPPLVGQNLDDYKDFYTPTDWTGEGKEAFSVRRTDQANSNPYMFFQIDNGYIPGTATYEAVITVKYFDIGTDKWSLKYDSASGEKTAGTITKGGTKTLKTATFTITDARFGGRLTGGADFYIDSRNPSGNTNDGNEWIHLVEVERKSAVYAPAAPVAQITAQAPNALLSWGAVTKDDHGNPTTVSQYNLWHNTAPYFVPDSGGTPYQQVTGTSWPDGNVLTQAGGMFYLVSASNAAGYQSQMSNRVGKFTFELVR